MKHSNSPECNNSQKLNVLTIKKNQLFASLCKFQNIRLLCKFIQFIINKQQPIKSIHKNNSCGVLTL